LGEPTYSNKRGCNGTMFAVQSVVTNNWYGWACPWELNKGCSMEYNGAYYYLLCVTGCYNKLQCLNAPANSYYTGPGTSNVTCPYACLPAYYMLGNGTCVPNLPTTSTSTPIVITTSTTMVPTTMMPTTTTMPLTTTTVMYTTTIAPPPMMPNIQPFTKVVVDTNQYCVSSYIGFDASAFKMPDALYLGDPVYSNKRGCNGTWFARLNAFNQWVGFVCPWRLNEGCNVINSSGYYVVCDSGCYNKAQCATCAAGAYETAPCTSTSNRVCTQYQANVIPSADLRTCNKYSDCDHCPRNGYLGQSDYNVWGCAGHELRMSFFGTETQSFTSTYVLMANYCVYYTNATYAEFCPECFSCQPGIN
jgi:hypothetical protein